MFSLNDKNTKLVLLVLVAGGVVYGLMQNKKALGQRVVLAGVALVVVVAALVGMPLLRQENFDSCGSAENKEEFAAHEDAEVEEFGAHEDAEVEKFGEHEDAEVVEKFNNAEEVQPRNDAAVEQNSVEPKEGGARGTGCIPLETLKPGELLPDANSENIWDTPANPGDISGANFLDAGYHLGVNTVGQSLRNANRQIRSEPPNPQVKVSPWLQTTIEPDTNRRPLEIGA